MGKVLAAKVAELQKRLQDLPKLQLAEEKETREILADTLSVLSEVLEWAVDVAIITGTAL